MKFSDCIRVAILLGTIAGSIAPSEAQELVPRAYWPTPKGTNVLILGYQYSTGDVVTDPTLPLFGVDSRNNTGSLTYRRTLGWFGRTTNLQISLPYVHGTTEGFVEGEFRRRDLSAMADAHIQLSINLKGAPSMNPQEFQAMLVDPETIVGASIIIVPPSGAYENDRVINAGSNRWSSKLELGAIWPLGGGWLFESNAGIWFFGDNDDFLGQTREQHPIGAVTFHLIKEIRAGFWASLDANYYYGGKSVVSGERRADLQRNSRLGGTVVFPFRRRHAVKVAYSAGVVTESGGDYDMLTLSYVYAW